MPGVEMQQKHYEGKIKLGGCMVEISGNRLVWRHIQRENQKMILDPIGYDAIKDIDEIHSRNRRKTDDPYIRATSEKIAHRFPEIEDAERR